MNRRRAFRREFPGKRFDHILLVCLAFAVALRPFRRFAFALVVEDGVNFIELDLAGAAVAFGAVLVEVRQRFIRRTEPREVASAREEDDLVGEHHVFGCVRDQDDRAPLVGEAAHELHERGLGARVETGGRLVEEEEAGFGEQFDADGDAFLLSAAQAADLHVFAMGEIEVGKHFHHALFAFFGGGVGRHAQLRGVIQRLIDRQLHVDDIFLRDEADLVADGIEVGVDIHIVDEHFRRGSCGAVPGDRVYEGGFSAAALPDDDDELARLECDRNILQDVEVFANPLVQSHHVHAQAVAVVVMSELIFAHHKTILSDSHRVVRFQPERAVHFCIVDEHAVGTAQVFDSIALTDSLDLRVEPRDVRRRKHNVVAWVAPDLNEILFSELDLAFHLRRGFGGRFIRQSDHHTGVLSADPQHVAMLQHARAFERTSFDKDRVSRLRQDC